MDKIIPFIDTPFVKLLTGVRRSGKSTILQMLINFLKNRGIGTERIVYMNFDSMLFEDVTDYKILYKVISSNLKKGERLYLLLDEIQEVKNWEKTVNSLMIDYDVDIYITGSNSRMLSSEIETYLTGRYVSFVVYPLSYKEVVEFRANYGINIEENKSFLNYLQIGGFPAVNLKEFNQNEAYTIVNDIYNSTIYKDIVGRNEIRNIDALERIVKFVFDNVGKTFSGNSISKYFSSQNRKISVETIYNYLSLLEKAFIIYRVSRYDLKGKEVLKTMEKFYLSDQSLKYAVLGFTPTSVSSILENIVYLELKRRGYDVFIGKWNDKEIDFVATKQNNKVYIQVSKELATTETMHREYSGLLAIKDNYPKYLLLENDYAMGNFEGIKTMKISDFLLSDEI